MIPEKTRILKESTEISSVFCWKVISRLQRKAEGTQTRHNAKKCKRAWGIWDWWPGHQTGNSYAEKELQKYRLCGWILNFACLEEAAQGWAESWTIPTPCNGTCTNGETSWNTWGFSYRPWKCQTFSNRANLALEQRFSTLSLLIQLLWKRVWHCVTRLHKYLHIT